MSVAEAPPSSGIPAPAAPMPGATKMLLLLLAINLFNYIDRQILSATLHPIELELFNPNDAWLRFKLGSLTTAFMVSYMLLSPVFGSLSERRSRWMLVGVGVTLWSLASGASGFAGSFLVLLLTRCFVGVGEAAYGPVAPSMISDMYPVQHRGRYISIFYMAIPVGSALGFVVGGTIADSSLGWRWAFYAVTIPGLLLGLLCFLMRDPGRQPGDAPKPHRNYWETARAVWSVRSFRYCTIGMTCSTFVLGGVATFIPLYIYERTGKLQITDDSLTALRSQVTPKGDRVVPDAVIDKLATLKGGEPDAIPVMKDRLRAALNEDEFEIHYPQIIDAAKVPGANSLSKVAFLVGAMVIVSGLIATLLGGLLGDWLRGRVRGAYFVVCGYSAILSFPMFVGMILVPFPYAWYFLFAAVFGLFMNTGPANTINANVLPSSIRASGFALNILIIHALGDAVSPAVIGLLADRLGWEKAMLITSIFVFLAGVFWLLGASGLDADTEKATDGK